MNGCGRSESAAGTAGVATVQKVKWRFVFDTVSDLFRGSFAGLPVFVIPNMTMNDVGSDVLMMDGFMFAA